jgi:hypothetical protein
MLIGFGGVLGLSVHLSCFQEPRLLLTHRCYSSDSSPEFPVKRTLLQKVSCSGRHSTTELIQTQLQCDMTCSAALMLVERAYLLYSCYGGIMKGSVIRFFWAFDEYVPWPRPFQ